MEIWISFFFILSDVDYDFLRKKLFEVLNKNLWRLRRYDLENEINSKRSVRNNRQKISWVKCTKIAKSEVSGEILDNRWSWQIYNGSNFCILLWKRQYGNKFWSPFFCHTSFGVSPPMIFYTNGTYKSDRLITFTKIDKTSLRWHYDSGIIINGIRSTILFIFKWM